MNTEEANIIQLSYSQVAALREQKFAELKRLEESIKELNRRHLAATGEYIPGVKFIFYTRTGSESDV